MFSGLKDDDINKMNIFTERYITTKLYKLFITLVNAECEEKDLAIQNRLVFLLTYT